jgi:hypothetical protein
MLTLLSGVMPALAPPAGATDVTLESRTYFPAHEDGDENFHVGAYEYLSLALEDLVTPGFFLQAGGWGRADLADETFDRTSNGEFQYGYLGYRFTNLNTELRLGRVPVSGGTARGEVVDGLQFRTDLVAGFDALAFGGLPVEVSEGGRSGDQVYGGRISQGMPGVYRLGVSYLKEQDDSEDTREEAGLDVYGAFHLLRPYIPVALSGTSRYNMAEDDFAQHDYRLVLGPLFSAVRLTGSYGWVDYANFFTSPVSSAFRMPVLDPEEQLQTIGGEVALTLAGGVTIAADYTGYTYEIMEKAKAAGARADWTRGGATVGVSGRWCEGDDPALQYASYAAYGSVTVAGVGLTASAQQILYEQAVDGEDTGTSASVGATYALGQGLGIGANVEYGKNPYFDSEVKGMLRLTYRYASAETKGGSGK